MERIGSTLQALRRQRKLTLREVEERSHAFAQERGNDSYRISESWLGRLEQEDHELTVNQLIVLAHIYAIQPEELLGTTYPESLAANKLPDKTTLLSPPSDPGTGPYKRGIIGSKDLTLQPLVPAGSVVQIDTRNRLISTGERWTHELQRPIYFLMTQDAYFCGWCELDSPGQWLTLVPHPLSSAPSRSWKYRQEVEIIGRVVAITIRLIPTP